MPKNSITFAPKFDALDHGVMVTLQVLVLSLWVRVPLVQHRMRNADYSDVFSIFFIKQLGKQQSCNRIIR